MITYWQSASTYDAAQDGPNCNACGDRGYVLRRRPPRERAILGGRTYTTVGGLQRVACRCTVPLNAATLGCEGRYEYRDGEPIPTQVAPPAEPKLSGAKVAFTGTMLMLHQEHGARVVGLGGRWFMQDTEEDILVVGGPPYVIHEREGRCVVSEDVWEAMLASEHWRFGERVPDGGWSDKRAGLRKGSWTFRLPSGAIVGSDGSWCGSGTGGRQPDLYLAMLAAEDAMEGRG